nr:MAG TPA: hypothetical protein [Bacteriophage sp.]DAI57801.1 MAG TPA: hypothetical protein [Caudoviricetes sp.]DAV54069.1 MAG TPA: hypothetical protein [Caudoviricetes sp.]
MEQVRNFFTFLYLSFQSIFHLNCLISNLIIS